jgi:hypothetical protein
LETSVFLPTAKLAGPVRALQSDPESLLLESEAKVIVPAILGVIGLNFLAVSFLVSRFLVPALLCGLTCLTFSAELLFRPRVLVSSHSRSIQILKWSWLTFRWRVTDEQSFADIKELLVEAEFELGAGDPLIWHLVVLLGEHQRLNLTWHFQKEPTMKVAQQLSTLTGKPLRVESDPTSSGRWSYWGYNFLR